jgi:hypothetical protein
MVSCGRLAEAASDDPLTGALAVYGRALLFADEFTEAEAVSRQAV